jgi:hypothetical protein
MPPLTKETIDGAPLPVMTRIDQPDDDLNPDLTTISQPEEPELIPPSSSKATSPGAGGHSTASSQNESPAAGDRFERIRSLLKASTSEVSAPVAEATASTVEQLLLVGGMGLNNRRERRTQTESTKWLLAPREARDVAVALGNIVGRRASVLEGVAGPDAEDVATIAMAAVGYGSRQIFNVTPADYERQMTQAARDAGVDPHGGSFD